MSRRPSATTAFVSAALVGATVGWWYARRHDRVHQRDLFSPRRHRRFAALGWLASHGDPGSLGLLHDYLAWETVPVLRDRARRLATTLEQGS